MMKNKIQSAMIRQLFWNWKVSSIVFSQKIECIIDNTYFIYNDL